MANKKIVAVDPSRRIDRVQYCEVVNRDRSLRGLEEFNYTFRAGRE